jgi:hypothetical protein
MHTGCFCLIYHLFFNIIEKKCKYYHANFHRELVLVIMLTFTVN